MVDKKIIPFTEQTNVKNRRFLVSMYVMSLDTIIQQNEGILKLSVIKNMKISTKTTHSYTLLVGSALINPQRKFLPQWKALPTNHGTTMGTKTAVLIPLPIFS